jgi:two-component system response regulator YesN
MDSRIAKTIAFIDKNIEKRVTLKEIAGLSRLSPGYLNALFRKETGLRFGMYLKEKRIERARILLANSELEIKDIFILSGYKNIQNFYHDFKKATGATPRAYKQRTKS